MATATRPRRARKVYENSDYLAFARRMMRALGRRVAEGDRDDLAQLVDFVQEMEAVKVETVRALMAGGATWGQIADAHGTSVQNVRKMYARHGIVSTHGPGARPAAERWS
jgi:hypothetical protein